jgi:hypothetical protein
MKSPDGEPPQQLGLIRYDAIHCAILESHRLDEVVEIHHSRGH